MINSTQARQSAGKTRFLSRQRWFIDSQGALTVEVDVVRSGNQPPPARSGMRCQLSMVPQSVTWLGAGPEENYLDRKLAAGFSH
ncbi:beta-galactosidase [Izhakiella capsodis]|uniref:Beta-galactosidase n=1 Tax=Izhakiella capsodis TaxID=1367852 RepID=A0A1I4W5Y5_9GAMM|nr:beta-galactosidase [Izhakiella capsodis]